jgi:hypothetical protein
MMAASVPTRWNCYPAVPAVPPVATAASSAGPPAGLTGSGVQAVGRPVRASRNPHPRYASAATREPEQDIGGIRGEPLSRLTVPKQRRASVRMAPSRQGSITPHGMADSAKTKTRAARHKHGGECGVKWPMRLVDIRQPRPRGGGRQQDTGQCNASGPRGVGRSTET